MLLRRGVNEAQRGWLGFWAAVSSHKTTPASPYVYTRVCSSEVRNEPSDDEIKEMAPYDKIDWVQTMIVRKKGHDVLADPIFNKGTAFSHTERERLGIRGLLPPKVSNLTEQKKNILRDYHEGLEYVGPEDLENWSISSEMVRRWRVLDQLQNRNETLFYNVLVTHITEMAPIIYTPTVGWVCMNYHSLFQKPRGMYLCALHRGEIAPLVYNWPSADVDAIVITDGSRVLGLGDQGLNGIGISVGKLDLYVAAGGFHPSKVLPIVVDVGTDNEALLNDPLYMGLKSKRMRGRKFVELMDEIVTALTQRYPNAVLQFEDFAIDRAKPLLERYRYDHLVFNDDIQGTACSALAGVYGALSVQNLEAKAITEQRVLMVGAGSAGMGVCDLTRQAMIKHGLTGEQASANFWVLDQAGLLTASREGIKDHVRVFARVQDEEQHYDGADLLSVVKRVKPTVLIGLSGAGPLFTQQVLEALNEGCQHQNPVVMAMSNPTARMECTAEQAQRYTGGRAVFASGSPQDDQEWNGEIIASTQANNMYIFPGLALGAHLGETKIVTDLMIMAVAEALPKMLSEEERRSRAVYPDLGNIRNISANMAVEVMKAANAEGLLGEQAKDRLEKGEHKLLKWVIKHMYYPTYKNIVYLPTGVSE